MVKVGEEYTFLHAYGKRWVIDLFIPEFYRIVCFQKKGHDRLKVFINYN